MILNVVTSTPDGFLAAGNQQTSAGQQAVIWTSRDGLTWQRLTAAQLGLAAAGVTPHSIDFATSRGTDTVITDGQTGVWLSINGGSTWTPVTVPVDHGAQTSIGGVSFDRSGLIAVRPGRTAIGAADGVAYFSPDGQTWQYAGTIDAAGGWSPDVVKGSDYGFVDVQPVSLAAISGGLIPEEAAKSTAIAPDGTIIAVGSADGYPAVWQSTASGAWRLVSSLTQVSAAPDLAGLSTVTRGPDGWLAVGTGPFVLTSIDGTTWRPAGAITQDLTFTALTSSSGGFTAAAQFGAAGGYRPADGAPGLLPADTVGK